MAISSCSLLSAIRCVEGDAVLPVTADITSNLSFPNNSLERIAFERIHSCMDRFAGSLHLSQIER